LKGHYLIVVLMILALIFNLNRLGSDRNGNPGTLLGLLVAGWLLYRSWQNISLGKQVRQIED
jgi:hypothetical protein